MSSPADGPPPVSWHECELDRLSAGPRLSPDPPIICVREGRLWLDRSDGQAIPIRYCPFCGQRARKLVAELAPRCPSRAPEGHSDSGAACIFPLGHKGKRHMGAATHGGVMAPVWEDG